MRLPLIDFLLFLGTEVQGGRAPYKVQMVFHLQHQRRPLLRAVLLLLQAVLLLQVMLLLQLVMIGARPIHLRPRVCHVALLYSIGAGARKKY